MREAANSFARISDLQSRANDLIADATGADAGYVASGASAVMTLAAAATIAGDDLGTMARLPDTEEIADGIVMARTHRTGYDHAFRLAGATIVDVGSNDSHLGTESRNVEPWAVTDAIGEDTVAIGDVQKEYTEPELDTVVEIAHDHDVPVIVDAAAELPPLANLERFVEWGADMVVFSGGKAVCGPQPTGFLASREEYIRSAAAQHLDMHAHQEAKVAEWTGRVERIATSLDSLDGVSTGVTGDDKISDAPKLRLTIDSDLAGTSATELVRDLREENPRVFVGADGVDGGQITINPMCLTDDGADYVAERVRSNIE